MNLIRNYRNWRRYRETVSELSRLSNRELSRPRHQPRRHPLRRPQVGLTFGPYEGQPVNTKRELTMNLIRNYRNWRRYRETVSELSRLSNRELADLGINRSDIHRVARKSI